MEEVDYWKDKPRNPTPYYCNICKIYCASAINLQTHFLGLKHKAVEEALKAHGIVKPLKASGEPVRLPESLPGYVHTEPEKCLGRTLEEQLNSCKDSEPAIGLQYIIEYRSKDNPIYECNLCICQAGLTNMLMHVLGIKHRMAYLKKHHPEIGEVKGRGSKLNQKLKELAAKIEQEEGRMPIRSTMDLPIPKDDAYSVQFSDSLVTWFSEEDAGGGKKKEDPQPAAKETDKKAEEASKTKDEDSKSEDKKESEQSTAEQQNAVLFESDSDSEEFTTNEGLLKYLKSFEIVDEDDAAFILKVTQKLTDALVLYREKASERKDVYEEDQDKNSGDRLEQKTSVEASRPHAEDDFSQWELPLEQSFEDMGTDSSAKTAAKRKASELPTDPPKDAKTRKVGTFVSSFKQVPIDPDSCDAEGPAEPQEGPRAPSRDARRATSCDARPAASRDARRASSCDARRAASRDARRRDAGRGPPAASRGLPWREAHRREAPFRSPRWRDAPSSLPNRPGVPPVPSQSESDVIGKFFNSIRNMDVDEVTDTLQKIAKSNPAFSAPVGPRKAVWIIGHDIIYWAGAYTASSGWGTALGLEDRLKITWMGQKGMQWDALLSLVSHKVSRLGSPDAIIIQLGENDIPGRKGIDLTLTVAADIHTIITRLPNTRFFWSDLLERREWPGATSPEKVDLVRRKVSASAGRLIEAAGGFVIRHPDITFKQTALFMPDGINLSDWGLDIWLHGIRHGLLCWLQS